MLKCFLLILQFSGSLCTQSSWKDGDSKTISMSSEISNDNFKSQVFYYQPQMVCFNNCVLQKKMTCRQKQLFLRRHIISVFNGTKWTQDIFCNILSKLKNQGQRCVLDSGNRKQWKIQCCCFKPGILSSHRRRQGWGE